MVEIINEIKALLENNVVLSSLNLGVITTAIGSIGLMFRNTKTKIATITSSIQNQVSTKIDSVKSDSVSTFANLQKEIDVLKTQNDVQVKLLTTIIKHAKWSAEAVPELAKTIAEYNELSITNVDKLSKQVDVELKTLSKELTELAKAPVVENETLVDQIFNG
jgi:hypothetical protein